VSESFLDVPGFKNCKTKPYGQHPIQVHCIELGILRTAGWIELLHYLAQNICSLDLFSTIETLGAKAFLIKGGHSLDEKYATDYLVMPNSRTLPYSSKRVKTSHTHGTGCVLSSAIATGLARGEGLKSSVGLAKDFLYQKLQTSSDIRFKYHKKIDSRKEPLL